MKVKITYTAIKTIEVEAPPDIEAIITDPIYDKFLLWTNDFYDKLNKLDDWKINEAAKHDPAFWEIIED